MFAAISYFEDRAQCIRGYTLNWVSLLTLALLDIMLVHYYVTRASMRKVLLSTIAACCVCCEVLNMCPLFQV